MQAPATLPAPRTSGPAPVHTRRLGLWLAVLVAALATSAACDAPAALVQVTVHGARLALAVAANGLAVYAARKLWGVL